MGFRYNDADHLYSLDGKNLPSVTGILKGCGIIDDAFYTDNGATNGKRRHKMTEYYDQDILDFSSVDDADLPFLEAYVHARKGLNFEVLQTEFKMYHSIYRYAGTIDRLVYMNDETWVFDLKTGAKAAWNKFQLILYGLLAEDFLKIPKPKLGIISLKANGRFEFNEISYQGQSVAIGAVMVQQWKDLNGKKSKK